VPAYLLGELSPPERASLDEHIAGCPVCAESVESLRLVVQRMKQIPPDTCHRDLTEGILARVSGDLGAPKQRRIVNIGRRSSLLRIAALFVALAGVCALMFVTAHLGQRLATVAVKPQPGATVALSPIVAVENARRWLQAAQTPDGGWTAGDSAGGTDHQIGVSSLALLALIDASPDAFRGPYAATVRRGIDHLVANQDERGLIGPAISTAPYNHGLATLAILNACSTESNAVWQAAGERALKFICGTQLSTGGWGYLDSSAEPANTSASIWPLQALIRADGLGYSALRPNIERGLAWLQGAVSQDGFMGYTGATDLRYGPDTMTAAGIVCLLGDNKGLQNPAVRVLLPALRRVADKPEAKMDYYRLFFVARAIGMARDEQAPRALATIAGRLASLQNASGTAAGSWDANDAWGGVGGRVYSTAMAALALKCN